MPHRRSVWRKRRQQHGQPSLAYQKACVESRTVKVQRVWTQQRVVLLHHVGTNAGHLHLSDYVSSSSFTAPRLVICLALPSSSPSPDSAAKTRLLVVVLRADLPLLGEAVKDALLVFIRQVRVPVLPPAPLPDLIVAATPRPNPEGTLFLLACSCMWYVNASIGPKASGVAMNTRGFSIPRSVTSAYMSAADAMLVRPTEKKRADRIIVLAATSFGSTFIAACTAPPAVPPPPPPFAASVLCWWACCIMDLLIIWVIDKLQPMMTAMRTAVTRMYAMAATCIAMLRPQVQKQEVAGRRSESTSASCERGIKPNEVVRKVVCLQFGLFSEQFRGGRDAGRPATGRQKSYS